MAALADKRMGKVEKNSTRANAVPRASLKKERGLFISNQMLFI
jgi:hypothetical protein